MLTIRTSKCNTIVKKPSSALFLWLHNSKGWFVVDTGSYYEMGSKKLSDSAKSGHDKGTIKR